MEAKKAVAALAESTSKAAPILKRTQEELLAHRGQAILNSKFTAEDKGDWIKMVQKTALDSKDKSRIIEAFEKAADANGFRIAIEEYNKALGHDARLARAQEGVLNMTELEEEVREAQARQNGGVTPAAPATPAVPPQNPPNSNPADTAAPTPEKPKTPPSGGTA